MNVEHLDRVFEPAIYPTKTISKVRKTDCSEGTDAAGVLCGVDVER